MVLIAYTTHTSFLHRSIHFCLWMCACACSFGRSVESKIFYGGVFVLCSLALYMHTHTTHIISFHRLLTAVYCEKRLNVRVVYRRKTVEYTNSHTRQCDYINFITHIRHSVHASRYFFLGCALLFPLCPCFWCHSLICVRLLTLSLSLPPSLGLIYFLPIVFELCVDFADLVVWMFSHRGIHKCTISRNML